MVETSGCLLCLWLMNVTLKYLYFEICEEKSRFHLASPTIFSHYNIHDLYQFNLNPNYKDSLKLNSKTQKWIKNAKANIRILQFPLGKYFHCELILFIWWIFSVDIYFLDLVLTVLPM